MVRKIILEELILINTKLKLIDDTQILRKTNVTIYLLGYNYNIILVTTF